MPVVPISRGGQFFRHSLLALESWMRANPSTHSGTRLERYNLYRHLRGRHWALAPRVTSSIVASTIVKTRPFSTSVEPKEYVLDKALNYGNSGGPILSAETGHVHAYCSRYQPVTIPQRIVPAEADPVNFSIVIPSLYGIVVGLHNPAIVEELIRRGIPLAEV